MSSNRRFLKAYGHIDAHGRLVPGMVILRKKKPTRGRWEEIQTYLCCTTTSTTTTTTTTAAPTTTTTTTSTTTTTTTTTP